MLDYLDRKHGVLYCSRMCALKDGAKTENIEPHSFVDYDKEFNADAAARIKSGEVKDFDDYVDTVGNWYGCLCPVCEEVYHMEEGVE